jgi:heme transport system permease protein
VLTGRSPWLLGVLGVGALLVAVVIAVGVGSVSLSPSETLRVLADHILPVDITTSPIADPIIWNIRLPRVLAAMGAGAALGCAGVGLQGIFRNPVADPQLVGMSAIGSVGVLLGLWMGWDIAGPVAGVVGGAIAGALGASLIRVLARSTEGDPSRFILGGIGFGVAVSALVAAAAIAIHDPRVPDVPFWFVGGLAASTWGTAAWTLAFAVITSLVLVPLGDRIDMLSLGFAPASHLGVEVAAVVTIALTAMGLGVGAAVGAAGIVAFVGLLAGHASRAIVGDHHRVAIVAGAVLGAVALIAADAIGRLIGGRFEVPVGLVTAAIGGPFLMWLIARRGPGL